MTQDNLPKATLEATLDAISAVLNEHMQMLAQTGAILSSLPSPAMLAQLMLNPLAEAEHAAICPTCSKQFPANLPAIRLTTSGIDSPLCTECLEAELVDNEAKH